MEKSKKLTDAEIVKALKTLLELVLVEGCLQRAKTIGKALDLINRQKAEIERLNKEVDRLSQCVLYHDGQIVDAVKEFVEKLCEDRLANDPVVIAVKCELKEMVGDA